MVSVLTLYFDDLSSNLAEFYLKRTKVNKKEAGCSVTRLGDFCTLVNFSKPLTTIFLPKSPTFLGNFCEGIKIFNFSSEIIFGQLL